MRPEEKANINVTSGLKENYSHIPWLSQVVDISYKGTYSYLFCYIHVHIIYIGITGMRKNDTDRWGISVSGTTYVKKSREFFKVFLMLNTKLPACIKF